MAEINIITAGVVGTNSYIISNNGEAIVIDPSSLAGTTIWLNDNDKVLKAILLTHGHFDHISVAADLRELSRCPIYCHVADYDKCEGRAMADRIKTHNVRTFIPDIAIIGGETLELIGLKVGVMHTPGHSAGSVCYVLENMIFAGDTIFRGSYGRYDFYDGSLGQIKKSISRVFALEGNYQIYPGHGESTTLDYERKNNDILWS